MVVGQTLQILGATDENSKDNFQWYQIDSNGDWLAISGATRNQVPPSFPSAHPPLCAPPPVSNAFGNATICSSLS